MALTINTNLSSMIVQSNLTKATTSLNQAIERMTTGYKINHAADNAAGYSIARNWEAQLGSLDVAADNAATGADMLATLNAWYTEHQADISDELASAITSFDSHANAKLQEVLSQIPADYTALQNMIAQAYLQTRTQYKNDIVIRINKLKIQKEIKQL